MLRSDSVTIGRITSGEELNYQNRLADGHPGVVGARASRQ
jgi:hypothetical protein